MRTPSSLAVPTCLRLICLSLVAGLGACTVPVDPAPAGQQSQGGASRPSTSASLRTGDGAGAGSAGRSSTPVPSHQSSRALPTGTPTGGTPSRAAGASGGEGCTASRLVDAMSLEQRVGQLVMVGVPAGGDSSVVRRQIRRLHVGNVFLRGPSRADHAAVAAQTRSLQQAADDASTAGVRLWVSTDQEGGQVQVLRGSGFPTMPSALVQGGWGTSELRSRATEWGRGLASAGVGVNLAPVVDTVVNASAAPANRPIGRYDRQFANDPGAVAAVSTAFTRGMADAGVAATAKHFPGLGLVSDNTDTTDVVTDTSTDASSPSLGTFKAQVEAGVPLVMMSSARYARIDPGVPAMMSPRVVGLVRALGFRGVVITDDLGRARAARVFSPDELATRSVAAGVDVLLTTIPEGVPTMVQALVAQARRDRGFDDRVRRAALTVLETKARQGLLPPRC